MSGPTETNVGLGVIQEAQLTDESPKKGHIFLAIDESHQQETHANLDTGHPHDCSKSSIYQIACSELAVVVV